MVIWGRGVFLGISHALICPSVPQIFGTYYMHTHTRTHTVRETLTKFCNVTKLHERKIFTGSTWPKICVMQLLMHNLFVGANLLVFKCCLWTSNRMLANEFEINYTVFYRFWAKENCLNFSESVTLVIGFVTSVNSSIQQFNV